MTLEYKINKKSLVSEDYSITEKQDQNFVSNFDKVIKQLKKKS